MSTKERVSFFCLYKSFGFFTTFCAYWIVLGSYAFASEPLSSDVSPLAITPKIIGGTTAVPGAWPWMAALIRANVADDQYYSGQFCGGALIAEKWVLTAAHCVYSDTSWDNPGEVDVVMGLHNLKTDTGERFDVKRIVGHPQYDPETFDSDLALLELDRPSSAQTLRLFSDATDNLTGSIATIIGWGDTDPSDFVSYPAELQQVSVPVVENETCNVVYEGKVTENMLCAGDIVNGKDSCFGDSGGPLMVWIDNQWQHAGIVSWADGCAISPYYGVNTRTSQFVDFITASIFPEPRIFPWYLFVPAMIQP